MPDRDSLILLEKWRLTGDQDAATELYHRHISRIIGLARKRLSPHLARRVDAEDVAASVARTFFLRVRDGRIQVQPGNELWNLLAAITRNKVKGKEEFHTAGKRSIRAEESDARSARSARSREPDAAEVLALEELRDGLFEGMLPSHRRIVELHLHGFSTKEISQDVNLSESMANIVLRNFAQKADRWLHTPTDK